MCGRLCQVEAVAYDNPIPGYDTPNTINLRLWAAKPSGEFDLVRVALGDCIMGFNKILIRLGSRFIFVRHDFVSSPRLNAC